MKGLKIDEKTKVGLQTDREKQNNFKGGHNKRVPVTSIAGCSFFIINIQAITMFMINKDTINVAFFHTKKLQ